MKKFSVFHLGKNIVQANTTKHISLQQTFQQLLTATVNFPVLGFSNKILLTNAFYHNNAAHSDYQFKFC